MKRRHQVGWSGGLAVLVVVLGLTAAACSSKSTPSAGGGASSPASSPTQSPTGSSGGGGGGGPKSTTVQAGAGGFVFSPSTVTIAQGGTLTVKNVGTLPHTFTIQTQGINQVMTPGQSAKIKIGLAPGTYPFVCTFHQSSGMVGTLIVT